MSGHVNQNKTMTNRHQYASVSFYQTSNLFYYAYGVFFYDVKTKKFECVINFCPAFLL